MVIRFSFARAGTVLAAVSLLAVLGISVLHPQTAHANSYPPNHLIDDYVWLNTSTMSQDDIQAFLVGKHSYLANYVSFSTRDNANVYAAQIIHEASQDYGINPQVILATMQKEESLVTAQNPTQSQLDFAMGYGCADATGCSKYSGFFNQVDNGTWQFRADYELSSGRSYWGYSPSAYPCMNATRYYSAGLIPGNNVTFYDDYGTPYSSFHIDNAATASLYCYTPHVYPGSPAEYYSGSQNFEDSFTNWGWSLYSDHCVTSQASVTTNVQFGRFTPGRDSAVFTIYSGSGSGCIETHVWSPGMQSWQSHTASIQPSVSYPDLQLFFGNFDGSGISYPALFGVENTSTGKVEAHVFNRGMKSYLVHTVTNQAAINPADCKLLVADLDGVGHDDTYLVCERNTSSGYIEIHKWNPGLQTWAWHAITNMPAVDPTQDTVVAGNVNGGRDSLILVAYNHTGSGKVEFHIWNPGFWSWQAHIASNMSEIDQNNDFVTFANVNGGSTDQAILVAYENTGSGKIEFHIWNPGFTSWQAHIASNQPTVP